MHGTVKQVPPALSLGSTFGRNVTPFFLKAPVTLANFPLASGHLWVTLRQSLCATKLHMLFANYSHPSPKDGLAPL